MQKKSYKTIVTSSKQFRYNTAVIIANNVLQAYILKPKSFLNPSSETQYLQTNFLLDSPATHTLHNRPLSQLVGKVIFDFTAAAAQETLGHLSLPGCGETELLVDCV